MTAKTWSPADRFDELTEAAEIAIEPVSQAQARSTRQAYRDFGKTSCHAAKLNFGDCFSYAPAKSSLAVRSGWRLDPEFGYGFHAIGQHPRFLQRGLSPGSRPQCPPSRRAPRFYRQGTSPPVCHRLDKSTLAGWEWHRYLLSGF
jgi:hypothetical protein